MMLAPWPSRLSAQALALAASLFCVSQVLITNLYLPLVLICLTRIPAAASAGLSNGAIWPDWSKAQPMMTVFFAAGAARLPVVPARAAIATTAANAAARMPHLVARLTAPSSCRETRSRELFKCLRAAGSIGFPRGLAALDQAVDRRVQGHRDADPRGFAHEGARDVLDLGRPPRLDVFQHRGIVAASAPRGEDVHLPGVLVQVDPGGPGDPLAFLDQLEDQAAEVAQVLSLGEVVVVRQSGESCDG